jgi:3-methyladenine DNA glycosylase Tag
MMPCSTAQGADDLEGSSRRPLPRGNDRRRVCLVWQIIEKRWPDFDTALSGFDIRTCALLGEERLEALCANPRIVRNAAKIRSVPRNAALVLELRDTHGSFGERLADSPTNDFVGLWDQLKRRGDRLGG